MTDARAPSWFIVPAPNAHARLRLFCIPYAGSGASCYHAWSKALAGHPIEVRAVQPPGRENRVREEPFRQMPALVDALAAQMEGVLDRPYCLFGHSMGAFIAFEVARALHRRGLPGPAHLFVSGSNAPQVRRTDPPLHELPDEAFVRAVSERYQGIPREVIEHRELRDLVLPVLRADLTMIETYQYREGPRLSCALSVLAGREDTHVDVPRLEPWRELTDGPFAYTLFDGDHFYLNEQRTHLLSALLPQLQRLS